MAEEWETPDCDGRDDYRGRASCGAQYRHTPHDLVQPVPEVPCTDHSDEVRCGACAHISFPEPPRRMDCAAPVKHSPAVRCGGCRD